MLSTLLFSNMLKFSTVNNRQKKTLRVHLQNLDNKYMCIHYSPTLPQSLCFERADTGRDFLALENTFLCMQNLVVFSILMFLLKPIISSKTKLTF